MDCGQIILWGMKSIPYVVAIITVLLVMIFVLCLNLFRRLNRLEGKYNLFMRDNGGKTFEQAMQKNVELTRELIRTSESLTLKINMVDKRMDNCLQGIGMIRFNALGDLGGEQSFALAVLRPAGDGVVISTVFGRENTQVYGKPIVQGQSKYVLSSEEQQAVDLAKVQ